MLGIKKPKMPQMPNVGSKTKWGAGGGLVAAFLLSQTLVITDPNETRMIMSAGKPDGFTSIGLDWKLPIYQSTFDVITSLEEITIPESSIALQNGTITAESIKSSAFVRFNGTRAQIQ